ncbi:NADH:ubiquinone oxidoreductase subunit J [Microlunatus endophyticus]|uniref:NADH-quinone oxidoreductase subunit J n=1 Tax=Microlunatus endophyticus TaxID=1716077 RepID=A0A917SAN1_9ACTN|nr:NADH:ubiquinone oxidoreductase subunit J [Microlunatus endophyticus]
MIVPLVTGASFAFWMLMPVMILGALGTILARKPVHSALSLAAVMVSLAVQYAAQQAPFLFAVQIIVYTGAILMLFLFVMMIVGVDTSESLVETIKGQRVLAILAALGFFILLIFAVGNALVGRPTGLAQANNANGGNVQGLAALIFGRYVVAFEATSALLITAALGAMVLAHRERTRKKKTQAELVTERLRKYAETGAHPGALPPPGVYARHNAVDTPALLANGEIAEVSVSSTLRQRGSVQNPADLIAPTKQTVQAIAPDRAENPATAVASYVPHPATPARGIQPELEPGESEEEN